MSAEYASLQISEDTEICQSMQMCSVNYSYTDNSTVAGNIIINATQSENSVSLHNQIGNHSDCHLFVVLKHIISLFWFRTGGFM